MQPNATSMRELACLALFLVLGMGACGAAMETRASPQEAVDADDLPQEHDDQEQIVGDAAAAPSWISVEREIDEAAGVERRLVVGTRSTDVTTLEADFRQRSLEITREYLRELLGDRASAIKLDEARLGSVIAPRRVFVQRISDGEGVSFVRYGQLVFDDSFRRWAMGEGRRSQQWSRLMIWAASFGGLVVILSAGAVRVRLSRRDDGLMATQELVV